MRRWWLVIALLLSLGVNAGILATLAVSGRGAADGDRFDRHRPGGPDGPQRPGGRIAGERPRLPEAAGRRLDRLADELGLAGAERERFVELQRGMFEQGMALTRERFRLQAELRRELLAPEPDRERVEALIAETAALFARLEQSTAAAILDSRELLDPEQEERYLRVVAKIRPRLMGEGAERPRRPRRRP